MQFDRERVRANVKNASTEDLLDRATIYRDGMEPEALLLVEWELEQRGIRLDEVEAHRVATGEVLRDAQGHPLPCSFCHRPAVRQTWRWHRIKGWVPVFPRRFRYCRSCDPDGTAE